jgi:hypothetical protein
MMNLNKLWDVNVWDVISMPLALIAVVVMAGDVNAGAVIGVIVGNRLWAVLGR